MVATRGWERLGFARLADYAAERAGMSARELRDLACVDGALSNLPRLEQAFVAGELGWTQLRLACRVARPENEQEWLALASRLTAPALAREVRRVDQCARNAASGVGGLEAGDERRVSVVVRCTPEVRARWWHARQVANRVAGHALSFAAFAEVVTAEVLSAVGLEGELPEDAKPVPPEAEIATAERGGARAVPDHIARATDADAKSVPHHSLERSEGEPVNADPAPLDRSPPAFAAALTRDLDSADAFELDARLCRAVRLETRRLARLAGQLERVIVLGLPRAIGYASLDAYAEDRLGMAPSRARALLRVARAASECAPLRQAFATGGLSWVQAHALVPLLSEPAAARHRADWVRHAERVSVRRLSDDIEGALATGAFVPPSRAPAHRLGESHPAELHPPDSTDLQIGAIAHSPPAHDEQGRRARLFFAAPPEVAHLFRAALATVQRRLEHLHCRPASQGEALGEMLAHALATWMAHDPRVTAPRDRRVFERDGWRCTVPGCSSYRNLHGHHIVFRSHGGSDALTNLTTLCAWHHQRGIHGSRPHSARLISCAGRAPHALHFALGLRPHHPPLLAYGPGEVHQEAPEV